MSIHSVRAAAAACLFGVSAVASPAVGQIGSVKPPPPVTVIKPPQPAPGVRPGAVPAETRQGAPANRDADGDGSVSAAFGGDDCNDANPEVFPGQTERPDDRDDDCNPDTIGSTDRDGDGYIDARLSNPGGPSGLDCDDSKAAIRPDAQELPNRIDDDCDGLVDNLLGQWWTPR